MRGACGSRVMQRLRVQLLMGGCPSRDWWAVHLLGEEGMVGSSGREMGRRGIDCCGRSASGRVSGWWSPRGQFGCCMRAVGSSDSGCERLGGEAG